jgi:hypothetical protein
MVLGCHNPTQEPSTRLLHPGVFTECAVHPEQRDDLERQWCFTLCVPGRDRFSHTEAKSVSVGKAPGCIVFEAGSDHVSLGLARLHPQKMLPDAEHGSVCQAAEGTPLRSQAAGIIRGVEAAVETDLMACIAQGVEDAASRGTVRTVGGVACQHGSERRVGTDHEPARSDTMVGFELKDRKNAAAHRIAAEVAPERPADPADQFPGPFHP